jgi:hypothetical protein
MLTASVPSSVIRPCCLSASSPSAATPARQAALPHLAKFAACTLKTARKQHVAELRSSLASAVGGSWPAGGERPTERAVQAEATLQAERPISFVDESLPRLHVGPPAYVKATGRIVASEALLVWLLMWLRLLLSVTFVDVQGLCPASVFTQTPLCLLCPTAVGDLHGDLQKALQCLELAGVLQEEEGQICWVGGDTTVVQLGDVLDRGDSEIGARLCHRTP